MKTSPEASTATPIGLANLAAVAGPESPEIPEGPITRDRGDHAGVEVDFADAVVPRVGDEQVSGGVHRDARGIVQRGGRGLPVVAAEACNPVARDRDDLSGTEDFTNASIVQVGDKNISGSVTRRQRRDRSIQPRWPGRRRR